MFGEERHLLIQQKRMKDLKEKAMQPKIARDESNG